MKRARRVVALFLVLLLCVNLIPMNALAEGEGIPESISAENPAGDAGVNNDDASENDGSLIVDVKPSSGDASGDGDTQKSDDDGAINGTKDDDGAINGTKDDDVQKGDDDGAVNGTKGDDDGAVNGTKGDDQKGDDDVSSNLDVKAVSKTNNIVGEVFANMINKNSERKKSEEDGDVWEEPTLKEYPIEKHELSYYEGSERVRYLETEVDGVPNYLVYRASYLLISQEDSKNYTVTFSEDNLTAYVYPSIPAEQLSGRDGIVFLDESIGCDNILVFKGTPTEKDGTLVVPLKATEDITVNMLFSDGRLAIENISNRKGGPLRAGATWNTSPSGTNWSATLTNTSFRNVNSHSKAEISELLLELDLDLAFGFDFQITTTGTTNGTEEVRIFSADLPTEIITISFTYSLEVRFDSTPIYVEGTATTLVSVGIGTHGVHLDNYTNPIEVTQLAFPDGNNEQHRKSNFYIGTSFTVAGEFGKIGISFWEYDFTIGPILSINFKASGGCEISAQLHRNECSEFDRSQNSIHTCTKNGEEGCIEFTSQEYKTSYYSILIDLFFESWTFVLDPKPREKVGDQKEFYDSLTYNSEVQSGKCPHIFYKVPVAVWMDSGKTQPAANMTVTVSDKLVLREEEKSFVQGVTGNDGKTEVFLPYKRGYYYTFIASGVVGGLSVAGTERQMNPIGTTGNEQVNIVIESDARIKLKTNIVWDTDVEKKEVSNEEIKLVLFKRRAGTDDPWERVHGSDPSPVSAGGGWIVSDLDLPKYELADSQSYLLEYCVRLVDPENIYYDDHTDTIIVDLEHKFQDYYYISGQAEKYVELVPYLILGVSSYSNAVGKTVTDHAESAQVEYSEEYTEIDDGDDFITETITITPVIEVTVRKKWQVADSTGIPSSVYLALLQKPADGWEDKANEKHVPNEWLTVLNPKERGAWELSLSANQGKPKTDGKTIKNLVDAQVLTVMDDIRSIENTLIAVGEAKADNQWEVTFIVPKFRNGIEMQYQGAELDTSIIEDLLSSEYDLHSKVKVESFGDYQSTPGKAYDSGESWRYNRNKWYADVINTDPVAVNTIQGTVWWQSAGDAPSSVSINVYNGDDPVQGSPIVLNKADFGGKDTWVWSLTIEDYDPAATYTVTETFASPGDKAKWSTVIDGLNVRNYKPSSEGVWIDVDVIFEKEPPSTIEELTVMLKHNGSDFREFVPKKTTGWNAWAILNGIGDISEYSIVPPDVAGYRTVIGEPKVTEPHMGNPRYVFTVYYLLEDADVTLHITKAWANDDTAPEGAYPESITVNVYRDDELIAKDVKIEKTDNGWTVAKVDKDLNEQPLRRLKPDTDHRYVYTVRETPVAGFTSESKITEDTGSDIYFTITNTWVGPDYVNLKGTINWEGDEEKEQLRPDSVKLSIVNNKQEFVKSIDVSKNSEEKWEWSAELLPGKDKDGNAITYSVMQSHVNGYTTTYADPVFDDETRTWTLDVTNKLTGYVQLHVKKTVVGKDKEDNSDNDNDDDGSNGEGSGETYTFVIEAIKSSSGDKRELPLPLNVTEKTEDGKKVGEFTIQGEGEITLELLLDEEGLYQYALTEKKGENGECYYDSEKKLVLFAVKNTVDQTSGVTTGKEIKCWIGKAKDENGASDAAAFQAMLKETAAEDPYTVTFTNRLGITIEKKWDIDIEGKDRPDSIEVAIQKKKDDKWETVAVVELNKDNDWKVNKPLPTSEDDNGEKKDIEYRVRELREETLLASLYKKFQDTVSGNFDEAINGWVSELTGSEYYQMMPDQIKSKAEEKIEELKTAAADKRDELFDELKELLGIASADKRIVHDKEDDDYKEDDLTDAEKERGDVANYVNYHVGDAESVVSGGTTDAHITRYKVKYESEDGNYKITNQAVLEIDVCKRWIGIGEDGISYGLDSDKKDDNNNDNNDSNSNDNNGGDDSDEDDDPESAWVVLMYMPKADAKENASGLAGAAGVNFDSIMDYYFPVINPIKGGNDPIQIISQMTLGIDLDIFSELGVVPTLAIAKVDKDSDWKAKFIVSKYTLGIPMEFKGAELGSEVIRQIVKYVTGLDLPISYNPFDNYFSIPTNAIRTLNGMTDPKDYLDLSKLGGALLDRAKNWKMEDIQHFGPSSVLDDWRLMANVFNVKIDFDIDTDDEMTVTKTWAAGDDEDSKNEEKEKRPESITVYIKDADDNVIAQKQLTAENSEGDENVWVWHVTKEELGKKEDEDGEEDDENKNDDKEYFISEEYPEGYEYKDNYLTEVDGYNITNTWHVDKPDEVTVFGQKTWKDEKNHDGLRPEKITIRLFADGEEIKSVEASEEGGWKWYFPNLPKYKEADPNADPNANTNGNENGNEGGEPKEIEYTIKEDEVEGYETEYDGYNVTNTHEIEKINITVTKEWDDNDDQDGKRPETVTIELLANGKSIDKTATLSESNKWSTTFEDLLVKEDGKEIEYTVQEVEVDDYECETEGDPENGFTIKNTHEVETIDIEVEKKWVDEDDQDGIRPDSVTVRLLADGKEVVTLELNEDEDWKGIFEEVDKYKDGEEIEYTLEEVEMDGYESEISGDAESGFTITNTHEIETISITVTKHWKDDEDRDGIRPDSVEITLLADGEEVETLELKKSEDWTGDFEDVPKYKEGNEIEYTIKEFSVEGYDEDPEITGDAENGFEITNTHEPELIDIEGEKIWADDEDDAQARPDSITIRLRANGTDVDQIEVTEDNGSWTWIFEDVPKYENGKEIVYTVTEDAVPNYQSEITGNVEEGFTVTNTYSEGKTQITVTKVWDDDDDRDGKRPDSVTVKLVVNGEETDTTIELTEATQWTGSFKDLPLKDGDDDIDYDVAEVEVEEYEAPTIEGTAAEGFTITNKYEPEMRTVDVIKAWDDEGNVDGNRPESITIRLYANGEEILTGTVTGHNKASVWMYAFENLPRYEDGKEIKYTVTEDEVEDYDAEYPEDYSDELAIVNHYTPEKITVTVTKEWDDEDNHDNIRPDQVTVILMDGDDEIERKDITSGEDDWTVSFENLPVRRNGKEAAYTVVEEFTDIVTGEDGPGTYAVEITGDIEEGFVITNTHTPELIDIEGEKTWKDNDNEEGNRPEQITIRLFADGEEIDSRDVSEAGEWKWIFRDQQKYSDGGIEIEYTIAEDEIDDYTADIDRFDVTNTYEPETTEKTVTKVWKDADDQDGIRPDEIEVELYADGESTGKTVKLSEENDWTAVFEELQVRRSRKEIVYTVKEVTNDVITGTDGAGTYAWEAAAYENGEADFVVTNTHTPEKITINVTKVWEDDDDRDGIRPESVTIRLLQNKEEIATAELNEDGQWTAKFEDLPKCAGGTALVYEVTEDVPNGYDSEVDGSVENGFTVTNTYEPETVDIRVTKHWDDGDDQDGIRPETVVISIFDGEDEVDSKEISAIDEWTCEFTGLPKNKDGEPIKYKVKEATGDVITGVNGPGTYEFEIAGSIEEGFDITNTHTPETVDVSVEKVWSDDEDSAAKRPDTVTIRLRADGTVVESETEEVTLTLSEDDQWKGKFENLPKYANGKEIAYTVTEDSVPNYQTEITGSVAEGFTVTNTFNEGYIQITVVKVWDDDDNRDGMRPENSVVRVILSYGGDTEAEIELSEGNNWTDAFECEIGTRDVSKYTVEEDGVPEGYTATVTGDAVEGFTVTNTHTPVTIEIPVSKVWDDADDQDGIRPDSVTVRLVENGKQTTQTTELKAEGWTGTFTVPKFIDGEEVTYTVVEVKDDVITGEDGPGTYACEVTKSEDGVFVLTNKHTPEKIDVTVTKVWDDQDNADGNRPDSVTFQLWADGTEIDNRKATFGERDEWEYTFTELDKYAGGKEIVYSITETDVVDYSAEIDGLTIINHYDPETTSVKVTKVWDDEDDQDGIRPETVTINLLANDNIVSGKSLVLSEDNNWTATFESLPVRLSGQDAVYTVEEAKDDVVTGTDGTGTYEVTITGDAAEGFTVTNKHTPETVTILVEKVWDDSDDTDGVRPESVTVHLLNGDTELASAVISDVEGWKAEFERIPKMIDGAEAAFTISEDEVEGYTTEITGNVEDGFVVTNSHELQKTTVSGKKTWNDEGFESNRPESITIRLHADGAETAYVVVSAAEEWKWTFDDLPMYEDGKKIVYTITEDTVEDYTTEIEGYDVINTYAPGKTQVVVTKVWNDEDDQDGIRPDSVTVKLLADGEDTGKTLILSEAEKWTGTFADLDAGAVYTVEEIAEGVIQHDDVENSYRMDVDGDAETGFTITNTHTPQIISVIGTKTWDDNDDQDGKRPESITIRLLADGVETDSVTVTEAEQWSWEFDNLPKYRDGNEISYTITEDVVKNYTSEITGFDVTNTYTPGKTQITVTKVWKDEDDQDGIRPDSVTVKLLADGMETDQKLVLSEDGKWTGTFSDLAAKKEEKTVEYTVIEVTDDVITGEDGAETYDQRVSGDAESGYSIVNTHTPQTIDITGSKTWDDADDQDGIRPASITIRLHADGVECDAVTVTGDEWKWTFTGLPKFRSGTEISYTITEDTVENYTSTVEGFDVTNSYTPGKTQVTVTKAWDDADDQDGIRPATITVKLFADGTDTGKTISLSAAEKWTGSFTDLDAKKAGKDIVYTVEEAKDAVITGTDGEETYSIELTGDAVKGFTITNTHTPMTITITGEKTWEDNNDQDGKRPSSITVRLHADGTEVAYATVTEADGWKWSFEDLPKNSAGKEIAYTITEDAVADYTSVVTGYNVTNTHTPGKTQVTVSKVWNDADDQDGIRPEKITVKLIADGTDTGKTLVLSETNKWKDSFADLDAKKDGKDIVYTVEEATDTVITGTDGTATYSFAVTGDATTGFTITNTHTPQTITVSGQKTWDDNDDQDGIRPKSIIIRLHADGTEVASATVTAADGWKWTFTDLPKFNGGSKIVYTVTEDTVKDYTSVISGFNVTNRYTPGKTQVTVTKVWDDGNNKDGIRPDKVTVRLFANGDYTGKTIVLSEANKWTASFVDLDARKNGKDIVYTVEEQTTSVITGKNGKGTYSFAITGNAKTGYTITNSHKPLQTFSIIYVLNGGTYAGSTEDITEKHLEGSVISIHEAPTREGYTFLYWKGSEYQPGDKYTVVEDHVFVAQWAKNPDPDPGKDTPPEEDVPPTPKTADTAHSGLWLLALLISVLAFVSVVVFRRKGWLLKKRES